MQDLVKCSLEAGNSGCHSHCSVVPLDTCGEARGGLLHVHVHNVCSPSATPSQVGLLDGAHFLVILDYLVVLLEAETSCQLMTISSTGMFQAAQKSTRQIASLAQCHQ
eukprot:2330558-Amphidinium_carterae.2